MFDYLFSETSVEKDVVLSVNGQESRMVFIDHKHGDMKVIVIGENGFSAYKTFFISFSKSNLLFTE